MRKESVYSAASSAVNLALVVMGVTLATVFIPRLTRCCVWWMYTSVAVLSFFVCGYLVQWVLSRIVNSFLRWLIFGCGKD
jgi:predicted permease